MAIKLGDSSALEPSCVESRAEHMLIYDSTILVPIVQATRQAEA